MIPALDLSTLLAGLVAPAPAGGEAKGDLFANLMGEAPVPAAPNAVPVSALPAAPTLLPKSAKTSEKAAHDAEVELTPDGEDAEPELPPILASLLSADVRVGDQPAAARTIGDDRTPTEAPNPGQPAVAPTNPALSDSSVPIMVTANPAVMQQPPARPSAPVAITSQIQRHLPGARMIDEDVSLALPTFAGEGRDPSLTRQSNLGPGSHQANALMESGLARTETGRPIVSQPLQASAWDFAPAPVRPPVSDDTTQARSPDAAPIRAADAFLASLLPQAAAAESLQPAEDGPQIDVIAPQLDLAHEGEWLDRLAKDIARTANPDGNLRFRLNPENLGSLHVEVSRGEAGAAIRLTTETEGARQIIADAQPRLIAEARAQGLRIAETHVDLGQAGQERGSADPQRGDDQAGQQNLAGDPRGNRNHGERASLTRNQPNDPKQDSEAAAAAPTSDRFA